MASRSLGTLTIDLVAKTAGFVQGMSKAERESAKWRRNVKKNIDQTGRALRNLSVIASGALVVAFGAVVKASARQEQAIRQVEQRLLSTGNAAGKTSEGLQAMAAQLQKTTTFGDEAVLELQSMLLTFTNIRGEIFDQTLPAILDLSVAMDQDLKSSAVQLGKALNDPIANLSALSRVGIQFTEDQEQVIKALTRTGRLAEAQGIIIGELNRQFGGAATAATDTFGGAVDQLSNAFGDLLENPSGLAANTEALKEFTELLQDPATIEAANNLTGALINGFRDAAEASRGAVLGIRSFGEDLAALVSGAAPGDIERLVNELSNIEGRLGNRLFTLFATDERLEELKARAKEIRTLLLEAFEIDVSAKRVEVAENIERLPKAVQDAASFGITLNEELKKVEVTAKKIGKDLQFEKALKLQTDYFSLVESLRTEEEVILDTLSGQLSLIEKINEAYGDGFGSQGQDRSRAIAEAFSEEAPEFSGLSPEVGGAFSELNKIEEAREELSEWYSEKLDLLKEAREQELITQDEYNALELERQREHQEALAEIEQARQYVALQTAQDTFGSLAEITKQFAGEQSTAYKILFAAEKAAAIARSIVAIQTAIAQASASAPFPANLAAMATVAAQTASIIANIQSTAIAGQAHDGMMNVPKTGTYMLEKGERVVSAETTKKLDDKLETMPAAGGGNIRIVNAWDTSMITEMMGSSAGEKVIMNTVRRNQQTIRSLSR